MKVGWKGSAAAVLGLAAGIVALAWVLVQALVGVEDGKMAQPLVDRQMVDGRVVYHVLHPDYKERAGGTLTDWQDPESGCHYWITPDGTYVNLIPRWYRNGMPMCPDARADAQAKWNNPTPPSPAPAPRRK